jgi:hypothetical protein
MFTVIKTINRRSGIGRAEKGVRNMSELHFKSDNGQSLCIKIKGSQCEITVPMDRFQHSDEYYMRNLIEGEISFLNEIKHIEKMIKNHLELHKKI